MPFSTEGCKAQLERNEVFLHTFKCRNVCCHDRNAWVRLGRPKNHGQHEFDLNKKFQGTNSSTFAPSHVVTKSELPSPPHWAFGQESICGGLQGPVLLGQGAALRMTKAPDLGHGTRWGTGAFKKALKTRSKQTNKQTNNKKT